MRRYTLLLSGLLLWLMTLTAAAQENPSPQGCRRGTPRPKSMQLRRGGSEGRTPGDNICHGERHQLTVLVAFNDRTFVGDKDATLEQWNKIFNAEKLAEEPFKGSVHDYFLDQSYGDFSIVFDLEYVQVSGDVKKYASTYSDDENSQYLVQDIVDILKQNPDIDWGKYDWNGDGYVNQLLIVYAGQGMSDYDSSKYTDLIWPHQWWMSEHLKDNQEDVYCDPITVTSGDKNYLVDGYCAVAELRKNNTYGTFGTICHEYSHCFGLPDFYYGGGAKTVGAWDIMDSGNFNAGGFQPAGYSGHERWLMGWLTPTELKEMTTIADMPALADEGKVYLIRNDGYENEYYFVENRQQKGWDTSLPGSGILIFHIDYDPVVWADTENAPNSYSTKRYEIFHANEKYLEFDNKGWAYPYLDNDKLTNTSSPAATLNHPNIDGTKRMSKPITNMKVTDGLASFDFMVEANPPGVMTPPEGLVTEEWAISAKNIYDEPVAGYLKIGFDGNDVYLQGLCADLPQAWIKGAMDGTTVTFAGDQYLGIYDDWYYSCYELFLCHEGATFSYDAAAGRMTAEGEIYFYTGESNSKQSAYNNLFISKAVEKAATPAMPDITDIYDWITRLVVYFNIPTVDVNGDAMASKKLNFQFLKEVDHEITPVTFSPDDYPSLKEPMDVIPYGFTDNADFFPLYIRLKQPDIGTWKKVGLQAIYYGAGECNKSDVCWVENPSFTNGISEVMPDMKSDKTLIFNLAGQRLTAPRKGLNIINGKKVMVK
ncbi:MAG: M6 family metalloprotease domain-containing protein [Prevotella sp.]|nr:M6 family metalloprotease domain-containing protein [Prevotella sp.]